MKTVSKFISDFKEGLVKNHIPCHFNTKFCFFYREKHQKCDFCDSRLGCEALTAAIKSFLITETSIRMLGPIFGGDFSEQLERIGSKTINDILTEATKLQMKGLEHDKASIGNL